MKEGRFDGWEYSTRSATFFLVLLFSLIRGGVPGGCLGLIAKVQTGLEELWRQNQMGRARNVHPRNLHRDCGRIEIFSGIMSTCEKEIALIRAGCNNGLLAPYNHLAEETVLEAL